MTISTNLWYARTTTAMQTLSSKSDTLSTQISTGKKLQQASDDPVAYSRLRGITTADANATAYGTNLDTAASTLASADTTLTSISDQLTRAQELAVQANTGTLSDSDRQTIGVELQGIVSTLASLANAQDPRGLPLFGGGDGTAAVTQNADGSYSFATTDQSAIPIADGQSVQASATGSKIFAFNGTNTLKVISDLATALQAGGDLGSAGDTAISDLQTASDQVNTVHASIGARAARVELEQQIQTSQNNQRETVRSSLEDTDVTAAVTELQKTMTILQATQASFTKLQSLSLFDYLK